MTKPKEGYQNPLLKKVNLPMFATGAVIRAGVVIAALGAAALAWDNFSNESSGTEEAPVTGPASAGGD